MKIDTFLRSNYVTFSGGRSILFLCHFSLIHSIINSMSNFIDKDTVFILDSYGLIFREYYAFFSHPLTDSKGQNVSALFGFFRNLNILLKNFNPRYFVAALDSTTPTFRHEQFKEYKANRAKTPDDLKAQFPMIEECLKVLGIPLLRVNGYEADDIIATIARRCDKAGRHCVILSADKDLQQLADDNIHMLKPDKVKTWAEADPKAIQEEWGVEPAKILDLLSLTGDSADNVPGVQGIGPKSALKLISEYGSLEGIYEHADEIKGAIGEKIRSGKDNAFLSKKLITLEENTPLDKGTINGQSLENSCTAGNFDCFCIKNLNYKAFAEEMTRRELPALSSSYKALSTDNTEGGSLPRAPMSSPEAAVLSAAPSTGHIPAAPLEEDSPAVKQNKGNYKACTSLDELKTFIEKAILKGICAFDTETDSLNTMEANLAGFSLAFEKGSGIYVPLFVNTDPLFAPPLISKKDAFDELKKLFCSKTAVIMHNAKFDLKVLADNGFDYTGVSASGIGAAPKADTTQQRGGWSTSATAESPACADAQGRPSYTLYDTMLAAWLLEPDRTGKSPYSLETLAEQKLGLKGTEFEEIVGKGQTFADAEIEKAAEYSAEDSDFTLQLWELFEAELKKADLWELFTRMEMPLLPVLADMEQAGIHLDGSILKNYSVELKKELSKIEADIYSTVGHEFNIASPKQLAAVLFEERGLKPGKKTKTGYSTDTDVLESLRFSDPVPALILEYRAKAKLLSTYVETLPLMTDSDSRIHTSFMQTGTATGRLSSKDPNLQNIPVRSEEGRKIRSAFTAPAGKILISADYAQIELVILAHLSGDKNLCQAFNEGIDVHKSTAALIWGIPMESVTPEMRRSAKTLNFGLMYGMGAFSLAKDLGITRTQAQAFIENYFNAYEGVKKFFDRTVEQAENTGYVETIMGRRRFIRAINSSNRMEKEGAVRIAKNSPIQGSAADIVKKAMLDVSAALKNNSSGARLLLQVHDELILECDDNEKAVAETLALIKDKMENAVKLSVPLRVSIESGRAWGEFH